MEAGTEAVVEKPKRTRKTTVKKTVAADGGGETPAPKRKAASKKTFAVNDVAVDQVDDTRAYSDDENVVLNLKVFSGAVGENHVRNVVEGFCDDDFDNGVDNYLDSVFNNKGNNANSNDTHSFMLNVDQHQQQRENEAAAIAYEAEQRKPVNSLKVIELLKDFEEKNKHNEWPSNTSIHCYWCCHKFNNTPFGIPVKYINERFYVYGCFCSLECCAAHNLDSKDSSDDIWERSSLINMLARRLGYKNHIKPAPSRLALKIFGGHMDVDEFREYCNSNKIMNINFPPMLTMTQQIEEINASDISNAYRYVPIDTNRIDKFKEKVKLKRNKPITNFKNTLDHTMNLKYGETR